MLCGLVSWTTGMIGVPLTLLMICSKARAFADTIDQDQTAQNVQSDLRSKPSVCDKIVSGTRQVVFAAIDRGRVFISGAEKIYGLRLMSIYILTKYSEIL